MSSVSLTKALQFSHIRLGLLRNISAHFRRKPDPDKFCFLSRIAIFVSRSGLYIAIRPTRSAIAAVRQDR